MRRLERDFYMQDTITVAKLLLGKVLVNKTEKIKVTARIVETEAYIGPEDKAAHSYGGKITQRNSVMFSEGGLAYIYTIYGMYQCFNIVTEEKNMPAAVLIRAAEPLSGLDFMAIRRFGKPYKELSKKEIINLTNGPGKLCIAMNIQKSQNGTDLCKSSLYICDDGFIARCIQSSARINIDYAEEYKDKPWRFFIPDNPYVSKA